MNGAATQEWAERRREHELAIAEPAKPQRLDGAPGADVRRYGGVGDVGAREGRNGHLHRITSVSEVDAQARKIAT